MGSSAAGIAYPFHPQLFSTPPLRINSDSPYPTARGYCRNPDKVEIRKASMSFPSGHSSFAFSFAMYCLLDCEWVWNRRRRRDRNRETNNSSQSNNSDSAAPKAVKSKRNLSFATMLGARSFQLGCIFLAFWISVSRIVDHHHHEWDVLAGSVLGTIGAIGAHGMWKERVTM
jgi:membrane-associated phospholipid phosphatase